MANHAFAIGPQTGTECRSVRLGREGAGASRMEAQYIGPTVSQFWGDDDYEFWVRVPPASLPKLAFELLREKFSGQLGAIDAFRDWCTTHGVQHEFDSWI